MQHGILGLSVVDLSSGNVVFEHNGNYGLTPASALKVITAIAAFDFRNGFCYKTTGAITGEVRNGVLHGDLVIFASGDPTLGSWRFKTHAENAFIDSFYNRLTSLGIRSVAGRLTVESDGWGSETIPAGWTWEDIGNYYGAGHAALNWRENQYDLFLQPGKKGEPVKILHSEPPLKDVELVSELVTGNQGSGDQAYIFLPPYAGKGYVRGSIPPGKNFRISGSVPDPIKNAKAIIVEQLEERGIMVLGNVLPIMSARSLFVYSSPSMDSIIYWFLQKSINLYGEAIKTEIGHNNPALGLRKIRDRWQQISKTTIGMNMVDASGLSPANKVSTTALATAMAYATKQSWYTSFHASLPVFNKLKMKSGTIAGVKSFVGYKGKYAFAIIVNNYNGSHSAIVPKIYKLLDHVP